MFDRIETSIFGKKDNRKIYEFKLTNVHDNYIQLTNYGATLKSIVIPDKFGIKENIILGYPTFEGYEHDTCYIGSSIGPFSNRIANAQFKIGNKNYKLETNDGLNNNHSGSAGFNSKIFDFTIVDDTLIFTLTCPDGLGGFPGNVKVKITYEWTDRNELRIEYFATTDMPTHLNFTNHAYFNLTGGKETVHNHILSIAADQTLECDNYHIPNGNIITTGKRSITNMTIAKMIMGGEHNKYYILNKSVKKESPACILFDSVSGRTLKIHTTYPGIQVYTGQQLKSKYSGNNNRSHQPFDGLCLECQYYPDSPNHAHFPNTVLKPENIYHETITYSFGIE
ncbi:aldose epimerase family protein [Gelidibacter japonicus]|uniref:aldose epimerase family protein n=1 Tax=Gelidibacter japonicus TaxID=1962232 RepID=UPI0013CF5625|nr:aldose epimerase family protein [Gelidibacter japonicus]